MSKLKILIIFDLYLSALYNCLKLEINRIKRGNIYGYISTAKAKTNDSQV